MQMCRFLYIDRCWKSDQERMGQMLEHLAKVSKVKFDFGLKPFHKSQKTVIIFRLTCNQPSFLQQEDGQTSVSGHYQLLLFPEGTNLTKKTRAKSDEFAAKTNQKPLKHLLHPRTTGFSYLAGQMRKSMCLILQNIGLANHSFASRADCSERKPLRFTLISDGNLDAIYDVTIAYPDNLPETEADLANGSIPSEIHFHIKRYYSPLVNTHVQYKTSNT